MEVKLKQEIQIERRYIRKITLPRVDPNDPGRPQLANISHPLKSRALKKFLNNPLNIL